MIDLWQDIARDLETEYGGDFVEDFRRTMLDEERARCEMVFARQKRIAAATSRLDTHWVEGLGEWHMSIDPVAFFHWVRRYGIQIWNDPDFIKSLKRDHPEVIVKCRSAKTMVVRP